MLKVPAKIKKSDIKEACLTVPRTKVVSGPLEIDGVVHGKNTLEFIGFRGACVAPGIWGGYFYFEPVGESPPSETITPEKLDSYQVKAPPVTARPGARPSNGGKKK